MSWVFAHPSPNHRNGLKERKKEIKKKERKKEREKERKKERKKEKKEIKDDFVQHSDYRGCAHSLNVATCRIGSNWLPRSPFLAVCWGNGSTTCLSAATRGGTRRPRSFNITVNIVYDCLQVSCLACCLRVQEEFPERMTNAEGGGFAGASTSSRLLILLRHFWEALKGQQHGILRVYF